jgi:hypothetical protein
MNWIKANLQIVITGVVSLALLGLAGFFLKGKIDAYKEAQAKLESQERQWESLISKKVYPNADNLEALEKDAKRYQAKLDETKQVFAPAEVPNVMNSYEFKKYLNDSIHELQQLADEAGIRLPKKFGFAFSQEKEVYEYDQTLLKPMYGQINDLKTILGILFKARIHRLTGMRRSSVDETVHADTNAKDLLRRNISTNEVTDAILYPYECSFRCYSKELAEVLTGFSNSDQFFVIKSLTITPVNEEYETIEEEEEELLDQPGGMSSMLGMTGPMTGPMAGPYGRGPMAGPYGGGGPYAGPYGRGPYGGAAMPSMPGRYGPQMMQPVEPLDVPDEIRENEVNTFLEERLLDVRMILQGIKLKPIVEEEPPQQISQI